MMRWLPLPPAVLAALLRLYRRTEQAELDLIAAGVAFYGFLAIFPAVAAVIAIWGVAYDPGVIRTQIEPLGAFLPPEAYRLVRDQVEALLAVRGPTLGWATLASTVLALWSARAGVAALIRGLNAIHRLPNRPGGHHQLRAMVLTLVLIGLALAAMVATVIAPIAIEALPQMLHLTLDDAWWLHRANQVLGTGLLVLAIGIAYRAGPNYGAVRPPMVTMGLGVAVLLWAAAARGFMLYLANFPSYNRVYGSIGAVVILLIWLYVSAYAVLLGAAVDAERHRSGQ
jgi:membrane protein